MDTRNKTTTHIGALRINRRKNATVFYELHNPITEEYTRHDNVECAQSLMRAIEASIRVTVLAHMALVDIRTDAHEQALMYNEAYNSALDSLTTSKKKGGAL